MTALNRFWRLLGTGYCFAFLFGGGLVLPVTLIPLIRLWPGAEHEKAARVRRFIHRLFRFYLWQMQKLGVITLDVRDAARLRQARGCVVIANHPSLLDVVLLIAQMPECCCIVKNDLRRSTVSGILRATGYIDNSDGETMLQHCRDTLRRGYPVVVFPEGTRSTPGQALVFQRGAAHIAVRCTADILPVRIHCDPPTLLKGEPWYRIPARKPHFVVAPQAPLNVAAVLEQPMEASLAVRRLNRYLQDYYGELLTKEP